MHMTISNIYILSHTVVDCGAPPLGEYMMVDHNDTTFMSQLTITIVPYHKFIVTNGSVYDLSDSFVIDNVTCLANGTWSVNLREISTESKILQYIIVPLVNRCISPILTPLFSAIPTL